MHWFGGYAFGRVAQYSLEVLGELSLQRRQCVELSTEDLRAIEFLVKRVSETHAIHISRIFLETFFLCSPTVRAMEIKSNQVERVAF